ncbi:MAG: methyltransferase domain-containing protein [Desulfococcaceae bacterium]
MNETQARFNIQIPEIDEIEQGEEFFTIEVDGRPEKIRFHDYDRIYEIPGLYEHLFYDRYQCNSPEVVCGLLKERLAAAPKNDNGKLTALDIGAGNGMVGEQLVNLGAETVVGIDIIEEAARAARRDRPGVYADYHVADLTRLGPELIESLSAMNFNCMTIVAALGFGDIPPMAFAAGYNFVGPDGWIAFNIKEDFVCKEDETGFCNLIALLEEKGMMEIQERRRYRHRFCQDGAPLYYHAVVGKKRQDIPLEMVQGLRVGFPKASSVSGEPVL